MNTQDNEPYYDDDEHMPIKKIADENKSVCSTIKNECDCSKYEVKSVRYCCGKKQSPM